MFDDLKHPHRGQPVIEKGIAPDQAKGAVILLHGRGSSAESMLSFAGKLQQPGLTWLAPQARNHAWYPRPFLSPVEQNEPGLGSALQMIGDLVDRLAGSGIPEEKIVLAGFSQGACMASEYAARNPARYGGVVALSGGLIGLELDHNRYQGSMNGTPVFLGCSDQDPHIPVERVNETAGIFKRLGANVTIKIYPGMGHTVNDDETEHFRTLLTELQEE